MQDADRYRFETFTRVRDFGAAHADDFPKKSRGAELFAALADVVAELDTHAATQMTGKTSAQTGTMSKAAARAALLEDLEAIRRTARAIALDNPAFVNNFRLPRGRLNDQELLATARSFAAAAVPFKDEFVRNELPADFLEDLEADIESFEQASTGKHQSTAAHVAATQAIDTALERGLHIVRQLDAVIRNKYRNDAPTLAAWTSASHTKRPDKHKAKPTVAPTQPSK